MPDTARQDPASSTPPTGGSVRRPGEAPLDDETRTPGDGTLPGSVPAGLTADELQRRAEDPDHPADDGGTG
jgi:hypothetical protein